jgi:hypothetical protein
MNASDESNQPTPLQSASLYASHPTFIDVHRTGDGGFQLVEQTFVEPSPFSDDDIEVFRTVAASDVPTVVAALGGQCGDDVIALLVASQKGRNIGAWLEELGVPFTSEGY